jgi:hypothetical protein
MMVRVFRAAYAVFVDYPDCVNVQFGTAYVLDHNLPGPAYPMFMDVVLINSPRKSAALVASRVWPGITSQILVAPGGGDGLTAGGLLNEVDGAVPAGVVPLFRPYQMSPSCRGNPLSP